MNLITHYYFWSNKNNNKPNGESIRVAVVTGGSSGIGCEIALMLARNEFQTYATMRNLAKSGNIKSIVLKKTCLFI